MRHLVCMALWWAGAVQVLAQTISAVATFENIGVEVALASVPAESIGVSLFYREAGTPDYMPGHPLTRIETNQYAGSLFWLQSGTSYDIMLTSSAFTADQTLVVTTRQDRFPCVSNTIYHVAVTGTDTNTGLSESTAFQTIVHAINAAVAGDQVWLHEGRYYQGDLDMPRSGIDGQPIVVCSAPGEHAILDGTDTNYVPVWVLYDVGAGIYRAACTQTPTYVYLNGMHFLRYLDYDDLLTDRWGQGSGCYRDGSYIYARFPPGGDPLTNKVTIPRYTTGITIDYQDHIHVKGVEFCYFGYDTYHRGIYINGGTYNLVDSCIFHHNQLGVALKRSADFNTIQHCTFCESPLSSWAWAAVKNGGIGYEAGGVGIYASGTPNVGNVIRYNSFDDMFDGSGIFSSEAGGPSKHLDYHHNRLTRCRDDALETDGAGSNCRIYNNSMHDFLTGISVAPCAIGPTYIYNNVMTDWHPVDGYEGYPFKFNVSSSLPIEWVYLYHNTCYTEYDGQDGFLFKGYSDWTNIVSRNNIYAGTYYALESWGSINPVDFDYDNLYTTNQSILIHWAGSAYGSIAAFYAGAGQEQHGMASDPLFVDVSISNYNLQANSPIIDQGVVIPGMNHNYAGKGPDIGANEFVQYVSNLAYTNQTLITEWQVVSGSVYQVECSTGLIYDSWKLWTNMTASNTTLQIEDATLTNHQTFYRLNISQQ